MKMKVGDTTIEFTEDGVRLTWDDGTSVCGSRTGENRGAHHAAKVMGYANMKEMFVEHEITHVALADWLQFPSPVMQALRGYESDPTLRQLEENVVLALQKYMRAACIKLIDKL